MQQEFQLPRDAEPSLPELLRVFEAHYLPAHPASARGLRSMLARFRKSLPERPTAGDLITYLGERVKAGEWGARTYNAVRKVLWRIYEFGRRFWPLCTNVVADVPKRKEPVDSPVDLRDPYRTFPRLLVEACRTDSERLFLCLQRWQGFRECEALGVRPGNFNWETGRLLLTRQRKPDGLALYPLKSEMSAVAIPVHPEVARLTHLVQRGMLRAKHEGARTFLCPFYAADLTSLMGRCRAAAPDDFPTRIIGARGGKAWHVFRHTYGHEVVRTVSIEKGQLLLRHKSPVTTAGYYRACRGRLIDAADLSAVWQFAADSEKAVAAVPLVGAATHVPDLGPGNTTSHRKVRSDSATTGR